MQHHAHVARTAPPHMRAHHMAVPSPHSQPQQAHMPPLSMAQPPPTIGQQQQQQQQQKQQQHLTNGPTPGGSAALMTGSAIGAPKHQRDHHTRLSQPPLQQQHQSQHPPLMHNSTQLQKLRQQHQHINNNGNSTNKNNYHHHQQPQQYNNGASNTHGNALPAQSAIQQQQQQQQKPTTQAPRHPSTHQHQHQQQQQQHPLHHQQHQQPQPPQQQQHPLSVTQMPPQQALGLLKHQQPLQQAPVQQLQTTLQATNNVISGHPQQPPPPPAQHTQPPPSTLNYYTAGAAQGNNNNVHKSKYNSNLGGGAGSVGMPPKTILQNPNRVLKARLHSSAAANNIEVNIVGSLGSIEETEKLTKSSGNGKGVESGGVNNVNNAAEAPIKAISAAAVAETALVVAATSRTESLQNLETTSQNDASCNEANKENVANGTQIANISNAAMDGNKTNNNINNNILSNEDSTVPKNSKEKTPMCLVNELARFNKITHQYRLTSEKGPAHSKRFTVTLKLGEEEYSAEGFKIKKAQHLAAADAIEKTKYKHPVPKVIRRNADGEGNSSRSNITPTVELNALAMKLGQETYYLLDPRQVVPPDTIGPPPDAMMPPRYGVHPPPPLHALPPPGLSSGHMLTQHPPPPPHVRMMDPPAFVRRNGPYAAPSPAPVHGHHIGGPGMRSRYGAPAQRAYMPKYGQQQRYPLMAPPHMSGGPHNGMAPPPLLHPHHAHHGAHPHRYGMPAVLTKVTLVLGKQKFVGLGYTVQQAKHDAAARALQLLKAQATTQLTESLNNSLEESDSKSPISLVHEIGIQRSLTVHFKVLREEGPAHMKKFVTACVVGSIVTEGEGNGKKISKKRAAEKMLEELKKLPPLTPTKSPVKRIKVKTPSKGLAAAADAAVGGGGGKSGVGASGERRKRGSGSIKEKIEVDADAENPITRLIQLQQNRKEKEPIFELIAKNGNENSRRREFIMEVTAHGMVARGTGNSKKLAKRNAAQNLLVAMGENGSDGVGLNAVVGSANTQAADKDNFTPATAATTEVTAATSSQELTSTVLQPIAEVAAPAAVVEAHLDLPLVSTPAGQVPGILILRHNKKHAVKKKECVPISSCLPTEDSESKRTDLSISTTVQTVQPATLKSNASNIAKESEVVTEATCAKPPSAAAAEPPPAISNDPNTASSATSSGATTTSSGNSTSSKQAGVHMKDQLLYLSKLLGFEVNFSDYPKGNHSEFLTIVTLSSNPPQICHGVGTSSEESQNDAARNALKILSELGLNNAMK